VLFSKNREKSVLFQKFSHKFMSMTSKSVVNCTFLAKRYQSFLTRLETRQSSENVPRPGRPRITTKAQDKRIITAAETNTCVPFVSLQNIVNVPATIRRRLHKDLIWKWSAGKPALLWNESAENVSSGHWSINITPKKIGLKLQVCHSKGFSASTSLGFPTSN